MSLFGPEITPDDFCIALEDEVFRLAIRHPELVGEAVAVIAASRARRGVPPEGRLAVPPETLASKNREATPKSGLPRERPSKRSRSV